MEVTHNQKLFFACKEIAKEKSIHLADNSDISQSWELTNCSSLSPCIVANEEYIAREIFSPIHIDANGKLTSAAVDDAFNKGMSVSRLNYCKESDVHVHGVNKAETDNLARPDRPERVYLGFALISVQEVRALVEKTGHRIYGVFDTSNIENHSHADVCNIWKLSDKSLRNFWRHQLVILFSELNKNF